MKLLLVALLANTKQESDIHGMLGLAQCVLARVCAIGLVPAPFVSLDHPTRSQHSCTLNSHTLYDLSAAGASTQ